ncbi:MAG: DNA internalization-related competence protein ComEC/Rec2 [Rhodothermales bacterium]
MSGKDSDNLPWSPALFLAGGFASGILLYGFQGGSPRLWMLAFGISVSALFVAIVHRRRSLSESFPFSATIAALITLVSAGALRAAVETVHPPHHIAAAIETLDERVLSMTGIVSSFATGTASGARFDVSLDSVYIADRARPASGKVIVILKGASSDSAPLRGQRVSVDGLIRALPSRRNPADFDYGAFLRRRGVYAQIYAEPDDVKVTGRKLSLAGSYVVGVRSYMGQAINDHLRSEDGRTVLRALLLGDRSGLTFDDRERLARSGLMHLLAVSGLHVLLVGMVLYQLLRPALLRCRLSWRAAEWARSVVTVAVLCTYMLVTGSSPSVVRAVTMATLFIGATLVQRPVQSFNTLGAAALILLVARPGELTSAGFQLSFSAVGGIILFGPSIRRIDTWSRVRHRGLAFLTSSVTVSLAATLATMPVLLYHFGRSSFAGLLLNVAAIPATFGLLSSGLMVTIWHGIAHPVADAFAATAELLAAFILGAATYGERWLSFALVEGHVREAWRIAFVTLVLLMLARWHVPRVRWKILIAVLTVGCGASWTVRPVPYADIVFFDVGQGDAILIRSSAGRAALIDAGPRTLSFDAGERILHPNLSFLGIDRLDVVVISHPHSDHLGGLPALLRTMPVGRVFHNGEAHDSALYHDVAHLLDSLQIDHQAVVAGDTILIDDVQMAVLAPIRHGSGSINDRSVVLHATHGDISILLTGDAEARSETLLTGYFPSLLSASIIKAGHHGSVTSSTPEFIEAACTDREANVVISVGERNRYQHPHAGVVRRWRDACGSVYLTSSEGAVWFRSTGHDIVRVRWNH